MWMARTYPHIPFERYADDAICHCKSADEAQALWSALAGRFAACKLVLHPEKTRIVYCKDANRREDFPDISFDFLGFAFRARKAMWGKREEPIFARSFQPAASPKALMAISRTIRRWNFHHRSDKALQELARMYNPCIQGWINDDGNFYRMQLRPILKRIDLYVIRWARRKFKRLRHQTKGHGSGLRNSFVQIQSSLLTGSYVMATAGQWEPYELRGSRTVLESPEVKVLRATRPIDTFRPLAGAAAMHPIATKPATADTSKKGPTVPFSLREKSELFLRRITVE